MNKKKQPLVKHVVDSPFQLQWPSIEDKISQATINLLTECLSDVKYTHSKSSKHNETSNKVKDDIKKPLLAIGINEVTRCLERGNMRGGVVCMSAKPSLLTGHLLILATTRCPMMAINNLSSKLAPVMRINSVLALGFKKLNDNCTEDPFADIIAHLIKHTPPTTIPWLTASSVNIEEKINEKEEKDTEVEPPREKKLKEEDGKEKTEVTQENKDCQKKDSGYVPLQVKTVVINNKKDK